MSVYYQVMSEIMRERWPMPPYTHPRWFNGVQTSIPAPVFARMVAHAARALVAETVAAESWRTETTSAAAR